ncbi:MAG: carboxylesterase/lipase family protein, partial [Polyangiales bacterium]
MTLVRTQYGTIEGEERTGHLAFRGIPFARPPVGALRFAAPEPPESWSSTRSARAFSASAMQGVSSLPGMSAAGPLDEDCLYLNVFTKAADRGRRPVLFWIHGGAFVTGSGSMPLYDGGRLCERGDVVVVTVNYRLGALGYLYLGEHGAERMGASANVGQLDQIAALRWVRENIAQFGGDPDNVTIFGESAGSMAVCALVVMPAAAGLFHRAIAQSGSNVALRDGAAASKVTDALLAELGLSSEEAAKLRELPAERIISAQVAAARVAGAGLGFAPVVDAATLPLQPGEALRSGTAAQVPLVIGTNRDELNLFMAAALRELDKP